MSHVQDSAPLTLHERVSENSKVTMLQASAAGKWPRFAWGWTTTKVINFAGGATYNTGHFQFLSDFYTHLSGRDNSGFLKYTFIDAVNFGQHPDGFGGDPGMTDNPDGYFLDYLGCGEAHWDD